MKDVGKDKKFCVSCWITKQDFDYIQKMIADRKAIFKSEVLTTALQNHLDELRRID